MRWMIANAQQYDASEGLRAMALAAPLLICAAIVWHNAKIEFSALPPLVLPVIGVSDQSPAAEAQAALATIAARPLFTPSRRPLPAPTTHAAPIADADRITGIVAGRQGSFALMQPKDGGKPILLHPGDGFGGARIRAITPAQIIMDDGRVLRPQFTPASVQGAAP